MNTDLQATFKLILDQAVKHNVPVSEMPTKVLILSDMEFDSAISGDYDRCVRLEPNCTRND